MTIPSTLASLVSEALKNAGDSSPISQARPVGGGCISNTLRLDTRQGSYLLKWDDRPLPFLFTVEMRGLALIRDTGTVRVPTVLAGTDSTVEVPGFILEEWIEPSPRSARVEGAGAKLGEQVAAMHRASAPEYGLDHDNYLGSTPQLQGWDTDWVRFFRERRLHPQVEMADRAGLLSTRLRSCLDRVLGRMDEWLGNVERQPALLHGDLWSGNVLIDPAGLPVLIDPAVYYGDREAELAYTELFGGFSEQFYEAYENTWPSAAGRDERRDLYNLYHLLNHLNTFGERYAGQVEMVARRYGGPAEPFVTTMTRTEHP